MKTPLWAGRGCFQSFAGGDIFYSVARCISQGTSPVKNMNFDHSGSVTVISSNYHLPVTQDSHSRACIDDDRWRSNMHVYIKEWADETATLMTDNGRVICVFPSIDEAQSLCRDEYSLNELLSSYYRESGAAAIQPDHTCN